VPGVIDGAGANSRRFLLVAELEAREYGTSSFRRMPESSVYRKWTMFL
jgi:hypothetical protein